MSFTSVVQVQHPFHPRHILIPQTNDTPYKCGGCQETGSGLRFSCQDEACDYHLHKDCAIFERSITHPFYGPRCHFKFVNRGPADTYCTACEKKAEGFVYYNVKYSLHPCCAKLQDVIEVDGVELRLQECVHTTKCGKCRNRNLFSGTKGWSYRSSCKKYHFHVSCVKEIVKDLVVKRWEEEHLFGNIDISTVLPDLLQRCGTFKASSSRSRSWKIAAVILNLVTSLVLGNLFSIVDFFVSLN